MLSRLSGLAVFRGILFGTILLLSSEVLANDALSAAAGGPGGTPYSDRCAPGEYLVGLSARSGSWLDAVAAVCAPWVPSQEAFGASHTFASRGGAGGLPGEVRCDAKSAVGELFAVESEKHWMGLLAPRCISVLTTKRTQPASALTRFGSTERERLPAVDENGVGTSAEPYYDDSKFPRCDPKAIAVGIFGSAGQYVNRIGLICASLPFSSANPMQVIAPLITTSSPPSSRSVGAATATEGIAPAASRSSATAGAVTRITPDQDAPPSCKSGFVWRVARSTDFVCVTPDSRTQVAGENQTAHTRVNPNGAFGPATCVSGYVWREAFDGDTVCVTSERRAAVWQENTQMLLHMQ